MTGHTHSAEQALFKLMADRMPGVVWATDADLRITASFGAGLAALDLHPGQAVGKTIFEFCQTTDEESPPIVAHRRAFEGESLDFDTAWAGRIYQVHLEGLADEAGSVIGCIGFAHDVTEQRGVEAELRCSETRWRSVVSNAPLFMALVDRDGTMTFLNRYRPGFAPEDVVGKDVCDFLHPEYRELARNCLARVFHTGEPASYDSLGAGPDGNSSWYETHVGPVIADGRIVGATLISLDISERKRAEEARRASEARYRTLAESTTDVVYIVDREGMLLYANATAAAYTGLTPSALVGKRQQDLFPQEMARLHMERLRRVFETGEIGENDELFHFGSEEVWLNIRSIPLRDEQGRITSVMGVCRNITDRKRVEEGLKKAHDELEQKVRERTAELQAANDRLQCEVEERRRAEEALHESEMRLRQAMRLGNSYAYQWDAIADQAIRSPECADILCLKDEEVLHESGQRFFQRIVAEDRQGLSDARQSLTPSADTYTVTYRLCRGDGHVAVLEETARGHFNAAGQLVRLIGIVADVTDRKRIEEALRASETALRQSERRFRNYFEQGLIGMAMTSLDKRWLEVNDRLCEIMDHPREQLLQGNWAEMTHPDDLDADLELFHRLLAGEIGHYTLDKRFLRNDGSVVYTTILIRAFRKDDGSIDHIVALIEDITERKQAQESLERERRTLKHLLQSSDHERQLIAYEIHDGLAQQLAGALMQLECFAHLKNSQPKQAEDALHAGVTMLRQGHFEARRLIAGVRPPILDESGVVAAVGHLANEQSRHQGPQIEYRSSVTFDRLAPTLENAIYRIVQEGLANACQHSKSERVRVSLLQLGDAARIEIRDWGIGFDAKAVPQNRFGLEGIRQRARLLGGKCSIRSRPGKGTRIVVELPVVGRD